MMSIIVLSIKRQCNRHHGDDSESSTKQENPANEATSKGADVGPVKHELALIVVLLLSRHTTLSVDEGKRQLRT